MNLPTSLRCLFGYPFWASLQLVGAFTDENAHGRARGCLAHALVADRLWLERIKGEAQAGLTLFPDLSVAEVNSRLTYKRFKLRRRLLN